MSQFLRKYNKGNSCSIVSPSHGFGPIGISDTGIKMRKSKKYSNSCENEKNMRMKMMKEKIINVENDHSSTEDLIITNAEEQEEEDVIEQEGSTM
jgi:hypothetical protein